MLRYEASAPSPEGQALWLAAEYSCCVDFLNRQPASAANVVLAARSYERLRRYDDALRVLRDGADLLPHSDVSIESAAIAATCFAALGDVDASDGWLRRIDGSDGKVLPVRLRDRLLIARALCAWTRGDMIEAESLIAAADGHGDANAVAHAKFVRSWVRWSRGKTVEQSALLVEALDVLERAEIPDVGLAARCAHALAAATREYYLPKCTEVVESALSRIRWTTDLQVEHFQTARLVAWSHALQAAYIPAIRLLHAARDLAPSPYFSVLSRFDRAWVSRIAGERASFEAEALAAAEIALGLDWSKPSGEESSALLVGAEMLASIDVAIAQALLDRYAAARANVAHSMAIRRDPRIAALHSVAVAAIAAANHDVNACRQAAKTAFDTYDGLGVAWRAAACAVQLYRAGCGDEWLAVARANVADYPRSFVAADIERLEGQRATAPGRDLTARQREIFALLKEGRSIDDIATRLICSRNTVRVHVGAIYRKIGVRNRVELLTQNR